MTISERPSPKAATAGFRYEARYESEERHNLLAAATVNQHGIAMCRNKVSGTVLGLAAVRIAGKGSAEHVPLERDDNGRINFPLPRGTSSRFGFFVGYSGSRIVGAAFRMGNYPGAPLVATHRMLSQPEEILVSLGGIKPRELNEHMWANEIDLYGKLAFDPARSRGLFALTTQTTNNSGVWRHQPLTVTPRHPDYPKGASPSHRPDLFQLLAYDVEPPQPLPPRSVETNGHHPNGASHRYQPAALGALTIHGLQAAFEVHITPSS